MNDMSYCDVIRCKDMVMIGCLWDDMIMSCDMIACDMIPDMCSTCYDTSCVVYHIQHRHSTSPFQFQPSCCTPPTIIESSPTPPFHTPHNHSIKSNTPIPHPPPTPQHPFPTPQNGPNRVRLAPHLQYMYIHMYTYLYTYIMSL